MTNDVLKPQPMSPSEIADLVERARANGRRAYLESAHNSGRDRRGRRIYANPAVRSAARHALFSGTTIASAAKRHGVSESSVLKAFHRIYPDVPALLSLRKGGSQ